MRAKASGLSVYVCKIRSQGVAISTPFWPDSKIKAIFFEARPTDILLTFKCEVVGSIPTEVKRIFSLPRVVP